MVRPIQRKPYTIHLSAWSREAERAIRSTGVTGVVVSQWEAGAGDLCPLIQFATQINYMTIDKGGDLDLSFVGGMVALEDLTVRDSVASIEFARLSNLRFFFGDNLKNVGTIEECPGLEELRLSRARIQHLDQLAALEQLRILSLDSVPLRTLAGIQTLKKLRSLSLWRCRRLESLAGIETTQIEELWMEQLIRVTSIAPLVLSKTLRRVELGGCKKIVDIEKVAAISGLEVLGIMTGAEIPSLHFLRDAKNLRELRVLGTKIVDGDFGFLLNLPRLELTSFRPQMRHYSHRDTELNKALAESSVG